MKRAYSLLLAVGMAMAVCGANPLHVVQAAPAAKSLEHGIAGVKANAKSVDLGHGIGGAQDGGRK